jgi:hypothetical protein
VLHLLHATLAAWSENMASIEMDRDTLTVKLHGWDPILALRKSVTVSIAHVRGARARPPETSFEDWITNSDSGRGLLFRGELAVGSVELADGLSFFDVHDPARPERVVAIDLEGAEFKHIVVDLDDETPDDAARRINAAVTFGKTPAVFRDS